MQASIWLPFQYYKGSLGDHASRLQTTFEGLIEPQLWTCRQSAELLRPLAAPRLPTRTAALEEQRPERVSILLVM